MNKTIAKIFSSRENLSLFINTSLRSSIQERCKKYNFSYNDEKLNKLIELTVQYITNRNFGAEFIEHAYNQILVECNKTGSWDEPDSLIRTTSGIEEILLKIEPSEEFARLHGKYLKTVDEYYLDKFNLRQYL